MERRIYDRLPSKLHARLFYENIIYAGIVSNLSENGMFICTRVNFPLDSMFPISLLQNGESFKISVIVRRISRPHDYQTSKEDNGIGVALLNPPKDYLEFVSKCRTSSAPSAFNLK